MYFLGDHDGIFRRRCPLRKSGRGYGDNRDGRDPAANFELFSVEAINIEGFFYSKNAPATRLLPRVPRPIEIENEMRFFLGKKVRLIGARGKRCLNVSGDKSPHWLEVQKN